MFLWHRGSFLKNHDVCQNENGRAELYKTMGGAYLSRRSFLRILNTSSVKISWHLCAPDWTQRMHHLLARNKQLRRLPCSSTESTRRPSFLCDFSARGMRLSGRISFTVIEYEWWPLIFQLRRWRGTFHLKLDGNWYSIMAITWTRNPKFAEYSGIF